MGFRADKIEAAVSKLDGLIAGLSPRTAPAIHPAITRWRSDAAALRFHLDRRPGRGPILMAVLGGTGTGKSTIVNRILSEKVSATSFRRTFTAGAVAVAARAQDVPDHWLGVEHEVAGSLPVRGRVGALV